MQQPVKVLNHHRTQRLLKARAPGYVSKADAIGMPALFNQTFYQHVLYKDKHLMGNKGRSSKNRSLII
jgi:hypothetical protein